MAETRHARWVPMGLLLQEYGEETVMSVLQNYRIDSCYERGVTLWDLDKFLRALDADALRRLGAPTIGIVEWNRG